MKTSTAIVVGVGILGLVYYLVSRQALNAVSSFTTTAQGM